MKKANHVCDWFFGSIRNAYGWRGAPISGVFTGFAIP